MAAMDGRSRAPSAQYRNQPPQDARHSPTARRRPNAWGRLALAMAGTGVVLLLCYALVYGLPFLGSASPAPDIARAQVAKAKPTHEAIRAAKAKPTAPPTQSPTKPPSAPPAQPSDSLLMLVNKDHPVDADYKPKKLVRLIDVCPSDVVHIKGKDIEGDPAAVDALIEMLRGAIAEGVGNWQISAGYRSIEYQKKLLNDKAAQLRKSNDLSRDKARLAALQTVAPPGASEHHTGLAFDITVPDQIFATTPQAKWLAANSYKYGFVLRYQQDKEKITGYLAEAWHFRYVGIEVATIMQKNNWCLEEYIEHSEK